MFYAFTTTFCAMSNKSATALTKLARIPLIAVLKIEEEDSDAEELEGEGNEMGKTFNFGEDYPGVESFWEALIYVFRPNVFAKLIPLRRSDTKPPSSL